MGYCVASGGNLLWIIVWVVVVICTGYSVGSGDNFYRLLGGEWW